ncbi:AAA family ATPase [Myxococcus stipitatus]|uniref:AAA family ATPase n=1 Tax=Myxococcus stipitatus TaxID=83455 RepID=UPI0030D245D1
MPIQRLRVTGYRSVRQLSLELGPMNVIVGTTGSGKPNLSRALCLVAALLSPRPPSFLALNEPETSLHPDLMEPLARGLARASRCEPMYLVKQEGATRVEGGPEDDSEDVHDEERG